MKFTIFNGRNVAEDVLKSIENYFDSIVPEKYKKCVYKIFLASINILKQQINLDLEIRTFLIVSRMIRMCYGEFDFIAKDFSQKEIDDFEKDDKRIFDISNLVSLKFVILRSSLEEKESFDRGHSSFSPIITSLKSLINLLIHFNGKYAKNDPNVSLIEDLFDKVFQKIFGATKMMSLSLASEVYVAWRTLHEAECIIKLLCDNSENVRNIYRKHIVYNNALRGGITNQSELDIIFENMKKEMKEHNLKSKDMKKYIEYGWLYSCKQFHEDDPNFKLNFRDGVERSADLFQYNEWYEAASEITHSSPIFFYSNDNFFLELSIVAIYQTSLRLFDVYSSYFKNRLFENKDEYNLMLKMRQTCNFVLAKTKNSLENNYGKELFNLDDK